jgi:hypothetical protein
MDIWPTGIAKNAKRFIVWLRVEEAFNRCVMIDNFARKKIYEKSGSEKSFIPKLERHGGISKQGKAHFNNMTMLPFSRAILLMSMRTRYMMSDANFLKEAIEFFILTSPISLHCNNFSIKFSLNKLLEIKKYLINIRMLLEQIYPSKFAKIIDEAYIV